MFQLTVDAAHTVSVTDHPDRDQAHDRLVRHAVRGDYYLRTLQTGPTHCTYELLALATDRRRPRSVGHAVIEEVTTDPGPAADPPDLIARAAQRWIAQHGQTWQHGPDVRPESGYPLAVLTAARAEARGWFGAGVLLPEAARLAGVRPVPRLGQDSLDALRRSAITAPDLLDDPADVITEHLQAAPPAALLAALVWWYALVSWGATVP